MVLCRTSGNRIRYYTIEFVFAVEHNKFDTPRRQTSPVKRPDDSLLDTDMLIQMSMNNLTGSDDEDQFKTSKCNAEQIRQVRHTYPDISNIYLFNYTYKVQ